jgi:hypothetical protein
MDLLQQLLPVVLVDPVVLVSSLKLRDRFQNLLSLAEQM